MSGRILVVFHGEHSTWGKVGEQLLLRGFDIDRCYPCMGNSLPEDMSPYTGCVIYGGPQSAADDSLPEIRAELDWLERTALPADIPLLGLCLGAQEIARVLGAPVGRDPRGRVEIGYVEILPTPEGCDFLAEPTYFYQWHSDTFGIPTSTVHLARSEEFEGQAFRYRNNVYAVEFHPEMTGEMVYRWSTSVNGAQKLTLPGAQSHEKQMYGYRQYSAGSDRWLTTFLAQLF